MNTVDDAEIIRRLHEGDQSVLATILKDIVPRHWRLLSRKFGEGISNEDFEDIIAVSLAKVWNKRHSFDYSKGDFSGWFYVILRNSTLDFLRRSAPKIEEALTVVPLPDAESSSEAALEKSLKQAITNLSERERKVLLPLFDPSGISIGDLSKELGISEGAVRQLRFRASQKLKRDLESVGYTIQRIKRPVGSRNTNTGDDHEPI
jgi:RNA polymerase sigma factor (sigma-70 family)